MEHLLKLVAAQSAATIGSLARAWLCVMTLLYPPIAALIVLRADMTGLDLAAYATLGGLFMAAFASLPILAVLAIIHVARNW